MALALGVLFIWLGCACLWVASHGLEASTPWDAYSELLAKMRGADASEG